jgi:hypothetical protein
LAAPCSWRPIVADTAAVNDVPSATPAELAGAAFDGVHAGAHLLNISAPRTAASENDPALERR